MEFVKYIAIGLPVVGFMAAIGILVERYLEKYLITILGTFAVILASFMAGIITTGLYENLTR